MAPSNRGHGVGHFWPTSGASGDMILGACVDAGVDVELIRQTLERLGLEGWSISDRRVVRQGIAAVGVEVQSRDDVPRTWSDIRALLLRSAIPETVLGRAMAVFERLAAAEAKVHGVPVDIVHFHEVGGMDAIVDIVGGCAALVALDRRSWSSSPVYLGQGTVTAAHGTLPVPAPATLELLQGVPVVMTDAKAEMCTPTGAAMLAEWVDHWRPAGEVVVERIGYGAGKRDPVARANVLRVAIGHEVGAARPRREPVVELRALIDDMSPELLAEATARLRNEGALDVWIAPVASKKGRTASALTCLCRPDDADRLEREMYRSTSTLGVRRLDMDRSVLDREERSVIVDGCSIRMKIGSLGDETVTAQPEHDDCVAAALATGQQARRINERAVAAFWNAADPERMT